MRMKVTFSDEEQAAIESLRGPMPAATWVRQMVRQAGIAANALAAAEASGSAVSPAGSSPALVSPRPPEAEIARAAAERSGALWSPSASNPLHQRPIVQKKNGR